MRRQLNENELNMLYHSIGKCIWHIQYLEDALHTLLTLKVEIKEPGSVPKEKAYELLAKHRRASLGTALGTAEKHSSLTKDVLTALKTLKDERDWLVHRSMKQDGDNLYTDIGRQEIFQRLDKILESSIKIKNQIINQTIEFCEGFGITEKQIEIKAKLKIAELKGEA